MINYIEKNKMGGRPLSGSSPRCQSDVRAALYLFNAILSLNLVPPVASIVVLLIETHPTARSLSILVKDVKKSRRTPYPPMHAQYAICYNKGNWVYMRM